ncbi:MAG: M3 family oligoendopeptidase [Clostridiales bacterium]|nr:M3 family oligoendopeptidase [Candidatus Blautia equi]
MYDRWSLKVLYDSYEDEKFQSDLKKVDELNARYNELAESLGQKSEVETIKEILLLEEEYEVLVHRLYDFCGLAGEADTTDENASSYLGVLMQKANESTRPGTILQKYIAKVENIDACIAQDALLKEYEDRLHRIQADDKYMLGEDVEEALSRMDISGGQAWSKLQSYLTSSVKVMFRGEETTLPGIRNMAYEADPAVRKEAYEAELACYEQIKDSVAFALNSIKMQDWSTCRMRGHKSPLDKVLYNSRMQRATLEALMEAMKEYMPNFHEYLKAKAVALGHKNGLPWYDLFAPMGNSTEKYSVADAKAFLMKVFNDVNPRMAEIIDRAFEEEWIDFFPRKGKVGGAFCAGLLGEKQFRILTNFDGSFSDVVTLAHELGHGYHDFMTHDNRPLNMDYSMPVAETASTFNENVVKGYALDHTPNDDEKLAILEGELSDVTQIICDIYSRFLFESKVVDNRESSFMFADKLCEYMLEAQKEAYGDGLDHEILHPYMWVCKGHYYSADLGFYNFPYAFGGLFARGLYAKFRQEGAAFLEKYNLMLKETPVRSVEDVAKICDIDLTDKEFWLMSLHSYDEDIAEFKRLTAK